MELVRSEAIQLKKIELQNENAKLRQQIELSRQQLIALECKNGKKQILVAANSKSSVDFNVAQTKCQNAATETAPPPNETKKDKKPKANHEQQSQPAPSQDGPIDISRIDLRIGKIVEIQKHPDADALYVEKINVGESKPRTIISGLVKHVPIEKMENRLVCVMCNLKPIKMRGITSEGMVMCASTLDKVEVLLPPPNSVAGDLVHCDGYERKPDAQLNPKKKIFETVVVDLLTNDDLIACYKRSPLIVLQKGPIKSETLKNVNVR